MRHALTPTLSRQRERGQELGEVEQRDLLPASPSLGYMSRRTAALAFLPLPLAGEARGEGAAMHVGASP